MDEKLREAAKKAVFSSRCEMKTLQCHSMVFCSAYPTNTSSVLTEQISEVLDEEFIHSSHKSQTFSYAVSDKASAEAFTVVQ